MTSDRRLTGPRLPRFVHLDGPEETARIQRLVHRMRAVAPADPQRLAYLDAVKLLELRERGFSEEDRAALKAWAEKVSSRGS